MLEKEIEQHLKKEIENIGGLCLKFTSSTSGVPDRIIICNSQTIFVELKAPNKKPRPLQVRMASKMKKAGALVEVIDSKHGVADLVLRIKKSPVLG